MKTAALVSRHPALRSLRVKAIGALIVGLHLSMPALAASQDDLFNAAKLGDAKEIAQEVARGADPNLADAAGNTLLITAAREEQPKVVAELIKQRGIKLDARNAAGDSALMLASLRGYNEVVELLLKAGANVDLKNDQNETADSWAAKYRNTDIAELIQAERKARAGRAK